MARAAASQTASRAGAWHFEAGPYFKTGINDIEATVFIFCD
jgi:hypothetical protein